MTTPRHHGNTSNRHQHQPIRSEREQHLRTFVLAFITLVLAAVSAIVVFVVLAALYRLGVWVWP